MTADKRSTHTDALETLGFILSPNQGARDAIHLAVEPVIAGSKLFPGEHVAIKDGKAVSHRWRKNKDAKLLGIVDPFLELDVMEGDTFWLVIYPRQITSLRHVWSHPDIQDVSEVKQFDMVRPMTPKELAYQWIQQYAEELSGPYHDYYSDDEQCYANITAEELISTARTHLREGSWGDYLVYGGKFEGEYTKDEFWDHLAVYLEEEIPETRRRNFFSCSC